MTTSKNLSLIPPASPPPASATLTGEKLKLNKITIRNFRCYRDEFSISFDNLTCIVAKNDTGKSTILEALDAFFNLEKIESDDRSIGIGTNQPIEITGYFSEIPANLVIDTDSAVSPRDEYLLNANGYLEIKKSFSSSTPKCDSVLVRAIHPSAPNFNDLFGLTIAGLRARANALGVDLTGINQTIKSSIRHAIWASVPTADLHLQEQLIEIKETIWKPLQNALPLYQLFKSDRPSSDQDSEAQDPIKFAIREALASREAELNQIGAHVRQQVEAVTRATIDKIREMDPALAGDLSPEFSSFNWTKVFSVSLTGDNQIPLNKRGSGVRRLFLINFFRAKAEQISIGRGAPDVILAIEEPETSQHPNNQILLLEALNELSLSPENQIIITTHNPLLARKIDQNKIRFLERDAAGLRSVAPNDDATYALIRNALGILPDHKIRTFIGVEGPNDIEFLNRISAILSATEPDIPNLQLEEASGQIVYIPMGGSTLELWTNRLQGFDLPEIHIMDRDTQPPTPPKYESAANRLNARGGSCHAFTTTCREMENLLHSDAINASLNVTLTAIQEFDDVPELVAEQIHAANSSTPWANVDDKTKGKKVSNAKRRLNRDAASLMSADLLNQTDPTDQIRTWLRTIGRYLRA